MNGIVLDYTHNKQQMERKFGALSSSTNPQELAKTVEGVIISISSVIVFVLALKGIHVTEAGVANFAQQAGTTIGAFGTAIGGVITIFGILRKGVVALSQK